MKKVIAFILAALFLLTFVGAAVISAFSADMPATYDNATGAIVETGDSVSGLNDPPPEKSEIDLYRETRDALFNANFDVCVKPVRVGVFYKYSSTNCLAFSHNLISDSGFFLYLVFQNEPFIRIVENKKITVLRDYSAKMGTDGNYFQTRDGNTHFVYHCITINPIEPHLLDLSIENIRTVLPENTNIFPVYRNGNVYIAFGSFNSTAESQQACETWGKHMGIPIGPKTTNEETLSVIDTDTGRIIMKIDTTNQNLYVRAVQKGDREYFIKSSVGNIFDGTFEYRSTAEGMELTNILDLDDYIKSVVPYEISASWPTEALKAFSIVARTYTVAMIGKVHRNDNFDMCDLTHCQVYRGRLRSTAETDAAVDATKGMVLTYNGELCRTYYHAVSGGATESYQNVWDRSNNTLPYLTSVPLPFEKYAEHPNGIWETEISPSELYDYLLKDSRVAKAVSSIKNIRVSQYTDAGYAYELEITDKNGKKAYILQCDTIRSIFSKYAKSAKFSIGKPLQIRVNDQNTPLTLNAYYFYQTDHTGKAILYTAKSDESGNMVPKTVLTARGEEKLEPERDTYILSGTGWGHGVGMSQYAAKNMAEQGYDYATIATYFYPGSVISLLDSLS